MKLPNGDCALVPMCKLVGYCLNTNHSTGKHKARVFSSVLGITISNPEKLEALVKIAAVEGEVVRQFDTNFGQQFKVDWTVPNSEDIKGNPVILPTIWEIASGGSCPRLVSAFVK